MGEGKNKTAKGAKAPEAARETSEHAKKTLMFLKPSREPWTSPSDNCSPLEARRGWLEARVAFA